MKKKLIIANNEAGERLDQFLAKKFPDHSRNYFINLIRNNFVKVSGKKQKPSYSLKAGETVEVEFLKNLGETLPEGEQIELKIIYEDENAIVINKQSGLVVHPAAGHRTGTLINALINHFPKIREAIHKKGNIISENRPGLVQRLDQDTSGIMIIAKNAKTMNFLSKQIQNRQVEKVYKALCYGWPREESGSLVNFLGRHSINRKMMAEVGKERGREAISLYRVEKYLTSKAGDKLSLIEFNIKTGRTHQIRVQAKSIGHPVLGDEVYNTKESVILSKKLGAERQLLHAERLTIVLPDSLKKQTFIAPLPKDFEIVVAGSAEE